MTRTDWILLAGAGAAAVAAIVYWRKSAPTSPVANTPAAVGAAALASLGSTRTTTSGLNFAARLALESGVPGGSIVNIGGVPITMPHVRRS